MKQFLKISLLGCLIYLSLNSFGQASDTTAKMSSLMVYGKDFMFAVREPDGWTGDIDNAKKYYSNIVFYKSQEDVDSGGPIVQVYNFSKRDEKTQKDLNADVKDYKKKYKSLKAQELSVAHKDYKCYSKTVYVEKEIYQYLAYVNPGPKYKSGFSIVMNISRRPATEDELRAFREIISSLIMFKG